MKGGRTKIVATILTLHIEWTDMSDVRKGNPSFLLMIVVLAATSSIAGRWYYYVAHAENPFDEVGISLNAMVPGPLNAMGCKLLRDRFEKMAIPPMGCGNETSWQAVIRLGVTPLFCLLIAGS